MVKKNLRILIYSHDSFGLGHLRRCRAIAHALVEQFDNLSVLILTGSSIIGQFDFRARVDFVRIPGVIKLRNGNYTPLNLHIKIDDTLRLRESIIKHTAEVFEPDLFIVDKEPWGLRGEVKSTLLMLKEKNVPLVLGLRDVMDDPDLLEPEWQRKGAMVALRDIYDQIWVYGLPQLCNPLLGLGAPLSVERKMVYTGYLRRSLPYPKASKKKAAECLYYLVTPGGGGDGGDLVDWVLSAYEGYDDIPYACLIILGPFMSTELQSAFMERAERLDKVEMQVFSSVMESLEDGAIGVIGMGGYNTFCEILSFDKPAIIVPRKRPRLEQYLRAASAESLGLVRMLDYKRKRDAKIMATCLKTLPQQNRPSDVIVPGLLDGLENVCRLTRQLIFPKEHKGIKMLNKFKKSKSASIKDSDFSDIKKPINL